MHKIKMKSHYDLDKRGTTVKTLALLVVGIVVVVCVEIINMCKPGTFGCPDDLLAQWLTQQVMGRVNAGARVRVSLSVQIIWRENPCGTTWRELKHPDQKKPGGRFGGRSRKPREQKWYRLRGCVEIN